MKPFCTRILVECPVHGGESIVAVEHDHGGEHPSGDVEQLWAAEVVRKGCECTESEIEEQAITEAEVTR